jgi:hypothetical protein
MSVDSSDKQPSPISDVKSEDTSGDPDSGDEVPIPSPGARILEVRCGNLMGKLYEERFTCPGIHRRCIEFEGIFIQSNLHITISPYNDFFLAVNVTSPFNVLRSGIARPHIRGQYYNSLIKKLNF